MVDLLKKVKAAALFAWDVLVHRFITEDVALRCSVDHKPHDWDSYEIQCCMADVEPSEVFDGIATVDSFQMFGFGITYRIGNFRPFNNPHDATPDVVNRCWDEANG